MKDRPWEPLVSMPTTTSPADNLPQRPPDPWAAFLSYLVPGLGQMTQGRFGKGLLFLVCLLGLFHTGQAMGNWQNVYLPKKGDPPFKRHQEDLNLLGSIYNRWHFGGQFWIGVAAWPALWQFANLPVPKEDNNPFWHAYQKAPEEGKVNDFLRDNDKTPDLGWVFTVIAGMLNILVIYDAFAGPAFVTPRRREDPSPSLDLAPTGQEASRP